MEMSSAGIPLPERFVHVTVRDTGAGIAPDVLQRIFEPLFTTKKTAGTDLGLAIVHQIIQHHGGKIFVESAIGRGTVFHLFLPAAERIVSAAHPPPRVMMAFSGIRLALIEDEVSVAAGLIDLLDLEGIKVHHVHTGASAVAAIDAFHPDLVVLDAMAVQSGSARDTPGKVRRSWLEFSSSAWAGHSVLVLLPPCHVGRTFGWRRVSVQDAGHGVGPVQDHETVVPRVVLLDIARDLDPFRRRHVRRIEQRLAFVHNVRQRRRVTRLRNRRVATAACRTSAGRRCAFSAS
jgi:hypothetical protein